MENQEIIRKVALNQLIAEIRDEVKNLRKNNLESKDKIIERIAEKIHALVVTLELEGDK